MVSPALGTNPLKKTLFKRTADKPEKAVVPETEPPAPMTGQSAVPQPAWEPAPSMRVVAFNVGDTRLGIDIQQVSCLVRMVEITKVPRSPRYMEGIINLRGQIVPVVSLHKLFGLPYPENLLDMYIIVGDAGSKPLGFTVDSMTQLYDVDQDQLERPAQTDPVAAILSWVAKLDDGIMFILDLQRVAATKDAPELATKLAVGKEEGEEEAVSPEVQAALHERAIALRQIAAKEDVEFRRLFTFALGNEKYAIDAHNVERVLMVPEIVAAPGTPDHFAGLINYAGDILWVLDVKKLLALPVTLAGNDERVVVFDHDGGKFGFLADVAYDVVNFPASAIRPALASVERVKDDYVTGEIHWGDDLVAILDFSVLSPEQLPRGE